MKELVIVSGKGGTGKTSISAALAFLAPEKVMADCDVDAANLHLVSNAVIQDRHIFNAGFEPHLTEASCTQCGKCTTLCRFNAIKNGVIELLNCEGCGVCAFNCPEHAITMREKQAGEWFKSDTRFGSLIHAELGLSVENSGKLVSQVRQEAKRLAEKKRLPLVITDGPPGIGCPAIAALSGANLVLAVVEPSISSIHDLKRLVELVNHFSLSLVVCINKSTLHQENTNELVAWCHSQGLEIVGKIPYSNVFRKALQTGQTVMDINESEVHAALHHLWRALAKRLDIPAEKSLMAKFQAKLNPFS